VLERIKMSLLMGMRDSGWRCEEGFRAAGRQTEIQLQTFG